MPLFQPLTDKPSTAEGSAPAAIFPQRIDYTTLSNFLRCPRYGYLKSLLGWTPEGPKSHDLIFGGAWHAGLEASYRLIRENQKEALPPIGPASLYEISRLAFSDFWAAVPDHCDESHMKAKTWDGGIEMLKSYWDTYHRIDQQLEVISVEETGRIQITPSTEYIMKLDCVLRDPDTGEVILLEHKTTSWLTEALLTSFGMSYQGEGYLTYLKTLVYDDVKVSATYNLCHITKTKKGHIRHTVSRKVNLMDRFLTELSGHVNYIAGQRELAQSAYDSFLGMPENRYFPFFPRTPGVACTAYMRTCEFSNICFSAANPLAWGNPPTGFTIHHWDPELAEAQGS